MKRRARHGPRRRGAPPVLSRREEWDRRARRAEVLASLPLGPKAPPREPPPVPAPCCERAVREPCFCGGAWKCPTHGLLCFGQWGHD